MMELKKIMSYYNFFNNKIKNLIIRNCIGQEFCSQKDQLKLVGELNLSENQKKLLQKYKKKFYLENTKFKRYYIII